MQQDQQGCKKNILLFYSNQYVRAEEGQITTARTKQHEDEEEDTGIRPAVREK